MFSDKELNLEENELREQIRMLSGAERQRYAEQEMRSLRRLDRYRQWNLLFFLGAHHFYLGRWVRGLANLLVSLTGIALLMNDGLYRYGALLLAAVLIIEIPQMLNTAHLVHNCNNRIMQDCLNRARESR